MSRQFLRALHERADTDNGTGPIRFVASTEGVKRDGMDLRMDAWDLDNYRKNPVVLWSHDYWGTHLPVGRAEVNVEGKNLIASVVFDPDDEFARQIERKYRNGFLNTVSVGWNTHDDRNELLDISAVPVPGDPDALMERQIRGLASIGEKLIELTDEPDAPQGDDAEAIWTGTALRMVRLFVSGADDAFDQRAYRRLVRAYQRLDREPPEVPDHLDALSVTEIRGLFLEGEPELVPELFAVPVPTDQPDDALVRLHALITGAQ